MRQRRQTVQWRAVNKHSNGKAASTVKRAATRRSFKARYGSKETKMPRSHTTQPRSDYASSFLHLTGTSPPRENCDQKTIHNEAPVQPLVQHHTAAHQPRENCDKKALHGGTPAQSLAQALGSKEHKVHRRSLHFQKLHGCPNVMPYLHEIVCVNP